MSTNQIYQYIYLYTHTHTHTHTCMHAHKVVKNLSANARNTGLIPELGRSSGEGNVSTPVPLPGESHGQRSLVGFSPWGH